MKCWTWSDVKTYFWEVAFRSRILYFVSTRAVNICIFKVTFNWYKIRFESAFKLKRTVSVHCWTLPAQKFLNFHNGHWMTVIPINFFKPPCDFSLKKYALETIAQTHIVSASYPWRDGLTMGVKSCASKLHAYAAFFDTDCANFPIGIDLNG